MRRPDRRDQIIQAAGELFHARGYAAVTVDQIASSLGISGPAIYKHFAGKHAVLLASVDDAVARLEAVVARPDPGDHFIAALADAASGSTHLGSMIEREILHTDLESQAAFQRRINAVFATIATAIASEPAATASAEFLARSMVAVASSASFGRSAPSKALERQIIGRALRVLAFGHGIVADGMVVAPDRARAVVRGWLPREEAILAALPGITFERGGIGAVTLESVGASAGISGPSVYNYFDSKADLWATWLARVASWSISSLQQSLAYSEAPDDVMRRALTDYVDLTRRVPAFAMPVDPSDPRIPQQTRAQIESFVSDYLGLWVVCAQAARPELEPEAAEALTLAAHAVINRAHTLAAPSVIPDDAALARLALAVFAS